MHSLSQCFDSALLWLLFWTTINNSVVGYKGLYSTLAYLAFEKIELTLLLQFAIC